MAAADVIIEPRRGRREEPLPQRALLVVNPTEAGYAHGLLEGGAAASRALGQSRVLVDGATRFCLAGPALGAPAAALLLEKLVVLGVRRIWAVSCCGSLDPALSVGDLLIGRRAVCGEGVSRYYGGADTARPGSAATGTLAALIRQDWPRAGAGVLWSTDAPYRERRSELLGLRERYGVNGVDMEFSALCSVAAFRRVSLGAVFVVSDLLWTRTWQPGFGSEAFAIASRGVIGAIIDGLRGEEA